MLNAFNNARNARALTRILAVSASRCTFSLTPHATRAAPLVHTPTLYLSLALAAILPAPPAPMPPTALAAIPTSSYSTGFATRAALPCLCDTINTTVCVSPVNHNAWLVSIRPYNVQLAPIQTISSISSPRSACSSARSLTSAMVTHVWAAGLPVSPATPHSHLALHALTRPRAYTMAPAWHSAHPVTTPIA